MIVMKAVSSDNVMCAFCRHFVWVVYDHQEIGKFCINFKVMQMSSCDCSSSNISTDSQIGLQIQCRFSGYVGCTNQYL